MLSGFSTIFFLWVMLASGGNMQAGNNAQATTPDHETRSVKITHGPVVELITDSTAQIAWSTNVNAGTLLHYGADPDKLDHTASMPWGGLTHRVVLRHLNRQLPTISSLNLFRGRTRGRRRKRSNHPLRQWQWESRQSTTWTNDRPSQGGCAPLGSYS